MSQQPGKEVSDELDERHKELAAREGDAYRESLRHMTDEVAHTGGVTEAGDFRVAFAQEEAEGMYVPAGDGELEWSEPAEGENCHVEVAVTDAADGRFVPELDVAVTLEAGDGEEVGPVELPFLWHPGLHHYGANLSVPGDGTYTLRVEVEAPDFARHDRTNGDRYAESVGVAFEDVEIKTGRK